MAQMTPNVVIVLSGFTEDDTGVCVADSTDDDSTDDGSTDDSTTITTQSTAVAAVATEKPSMLIPILAIGGLLAVVMVMKKK